MKQLTLPRPTIVEVVVAAPRAKCGRCFEFLARGREGEHRCRESL